MHPYKYLWLNLGGFVRFLTRSFHFSVIGHVWKSYLLELCDVTTVLQEVRTRSGHHWLLTNNIAAYLPLAGNVATARRPTCHPAQELQRHSIIIWNLAKLNAATLHIHDKSGCISVYCYKVANVWPQYATLYALIARMKRIYQCEDDVNIHFEINFLNNRHNKPLAGIQQPWRAENLFQKFFAVYTSYATNFTLMLSWLVKK